MTELEKINHARIYMDNLAEGIDPITCAVLPEDTVLNDINLSRCFSFISGVLQQIIENGGVAQIS